MSRILLFQLSPRILASAILASGLTVSEKQTPVAKQQPVIIKSTENNNNDDQHAVTLLSFAKDGKINFNVTGLNSILEKVKDLPIVVYSINGSSRTGKSYLLNYFVRFLNFEVNPSLPHPNESSQWFTTDPDQLNAFKWRSGSAAETKGIQVWSEPFIVNRGGKKVAVLLMDCQGLFDKATSSQQNYVIIAISNILSSVSIFNIKNKLDEQVLDHINCSSEYSRSLHKDHCDPHQELIFLIRDFDFSGEFDYGYHNKNLNGDGQGDKNYYLDFFDVEVVDINMLVRKKIQDAFDNINMYLMPDPGKPFRNDSIGTIPDDDFQFYLNKFIHLLNTDEHAVPKISQDNYVTGKNLQRQVQTMATIFTHCDDLPAVRSYTELMIKIQNDEKVADIMTWVEEAGENWQKDNPDGVSDGKITAFIVKVQFEANDMFQKEITMGGKEAIQKYWVELEKRYGEFSRKLKNQNKQTREAVFAKQLEDFNKMYWIKQGSAGFVGVGAASIISPWLIPSAIAVNVALHYFEEKPKPHWYNENEE